MLGAGALPSACDEDHSESAAPSSLSDLAHVTDIG